MEKELILKIQHFESIFLTRLENRYGIILIEETNRDIREVHTLTTSLKAWIKDNETPAKHPDGISELVLSYFTDEIAEFNVLLSKSLTEIIKSSDANAVNGYINTLCMAIAHENVKMKAFERLIKISTNN